MLEPITYSLVAALVGLMVGLTGVGGGAIMTPTLIVLFQIPPVIAVATDLVFATLTKLVSALIHSRARAVDWRATKLLWSGSIPGTLIGVVTLVLLGVTFGDLLVVLLVLVLLATSLSMLRSSGVSPSGFWTNNRTRFGGALIGFSVATTSVGAGALGMALLRSRIGDGDPKRLVGTDIVHAIPIAMIAGISYGFFGFMDWQLLMNLLAGSIPGVVVGSLLAGRLNTNLLRKVLAAMLAVAAIGVLFKIL